MRYVLWGLVLGWGEIEKSLISPPRQKIKKHEFNLVGGNKMKYNKVNLFMVMNKLDEMEKNINSLYSKLTEREYVDIDYTEYIRTDLSDLEVCWKYKGLYFKTPSLLHDLLTQEGTYTKTKPTFNNMLKDPTRLDELRTYSIQVIYIKFVDGLDYYIACDGRVLTKKLKLLKGNPHNSYFTVRKDGESIVFSRAELAYNRFIDPKYKGNLLHMDNDYGNCAIDNIIEINRTNKEV